jgi:hypothetical protein
MTELPEISILVGEVHNSDMAWLASADLKKELSTCEFNTVHDVQVSAAKHCEDVVNGKRFNYMACAINLSFLSGMTAGVGLLFAILIGGWTLLDVI